MLHIDGETTGTVYFILSKEEAEQLVSKMMPEQAVTNFKGTEVNPLAISILQEAGNILTGSYLTALSDFLNLDMQPSIPYFGCDMAGAILSVGFVEIAYFTDFAIIIVTKINDHVMVIGIISKFFLLCV